METKKIRLLVDVSVVITIDEDKIGCEDALLKAIASGDITEVMAPCQLMDERYDNDDMGELQWDINVPMNTLCFSDSETYVKQKEKQYIEVDNEYCTDVCPCCGSSNIEGGHIEVDADGAHQPITCHNCGAEYDDNYRLTGYEITSEGRDMSGDDSEGEYQCTKCDRYFTDEDVETFSPCVCKVCAQNEDEPSYGWQVSDDDIALALSEMNLPNGENDIEEVLEYLDCDEVEAEAMKADTLNRQTELAQANIIEQINRNL